MQCGKRGHDEAQPYRRDSRKPKQRLLYISYILHQTTTYVFYITYYQRISYELLHRKWLMMLLFWCKYTKIIPIATALPLFSSFFLSPKS